MDNEKNDEMTWVYCVKTTSVGEPLAAFATFKEAAYMAQPFVFGDITVEDLVVPVPLFASMEVV